MPLLQCLIFTTVQSAQAFNAYSREFALSHRRHYAFGCTVKGRLWVLRGRRPLHGCCI